jgi:hypothetical protein
MNFLCIDICIINMHDHMIGICMYKRMQSFKSITCASRMLRRPNGSRFLLDCVASGTGKCHI